jgi:membrane dipeptidase
MAMPRQIATAARAAAAAAVAVALSACAPAADVADMMLNPTGERPAIEAAQQAFHNRFMVADLHADTLMWHRGLREYSSWGQVDLNRLKTGNVGLQVFTMVTRAPVPSAAEPCTSAGNFDPTPLLAFASGWSAATWRSSYQRALVQAQAFRDAVATKRRSGIELVQIRSLSDLESWLARRFPRPGQQNTNIIAGILGAEGAHAFDPDLGSEFDTLWREYGLRLVGPIHHFSNAYGESSEACKGDTPGLTKEGRRLVRELFDRRMIVDLAHASTASIRGAVKIARDKERPVLASHTGVKSHLSRLYAGTTDAGKLQAIRRAMSADEIKMIAGTGGTTGIIYWKDQIGEARVDNVVDAIMQAYCDLAAIEGTTPAGGFHKIETAGKYLSLGSDWDGAAYNAIDAAHVAAVTERLRQKLSDDEIAGIVGRNACRVIAQSLSGGTFADAEGLCSRYGDPATGLSKEDDAARKARQREHCPNLSKP